MSSGRHRRDSAPDEQPWPDRERPDRDRPDQDWPDRDGTDQPQRRQARDETAPDRPAWQEPIRYDLPPRYEQDEQPPRRAADETSVDLPRLAADETSFDLPAWDDRGRPEQTPRRWAPDETSVDLPRQAMDETSLDLPGQAADETSVDLHRQTARDTSVDLPRQTADETSFDRPAWDDRDLPQLPPRRPTVDETVVDLPAWDERSPRARARAGQTGRPVRNGPPNRSASHAGDRSAGRKTRSRGALRMMIAAAVVAVIGVGVSVYGLTTKTTVAGAQYTPPSVGNSVPNAKPDPAALALSRSTPVKIEIPSIGVSAPIEQVGLLTNGEVQTPPLTVHNLTGWYKYGPTPGEDGASVILGHVDDYKGLSVFYYLKDLAKGDQIGVTLSDGITANFVVDGLQKASKDNFPTQEVYGKIGYPGLRLITCGGVFDSATGHYDSNIIVYAHLVHSATT
jgi:sortase (surface protein transpeptidase)